MSGGSSYHRASCASVPECNVRFRKNKLIVRVNAVNKAGFVAINLLPAKRFAANTFLTIDRAF